jgi:uncharacterized protein with HEPN domain
VTEHDDRIYLEHIANMSALLNRAARLGKELFVSDVDVRDATIYRLQTLAESTQLFPPSSRPHIQKYPGPTSQGSATEQSTDTSASTWTSSGT